MSAAGRTEGSESKKGNSCSGAGGGGSGGGVGCKDRKKSGVVVNGKSEEIDGETSSLGSELLLTLKGNLEALGASRAALNRDDPGGDGGGDGGGGGSTPGDSVTKSDVIRHRQAADDTGPGAADAGAAAGAAAASDAPTASLHGHARDPAAAAATATADAAFAATAATAADRAARGTPERVSSDSARGSESASTIEAAPGQGAAALSEGPGRVGNDDDRLRCLHESYSARPEPSLLPLYPPGNPFLLCNGSSNGSTAGKDGSKGGSGGGSGDDIGYPVSESVSNSSADDGVGDGKNGVVLVRVPHEHFLRMPLSPSMLEDHSMKSYQRALAGLSEKDPIGV